jgi:hypothetical protein
MQGGDRDQCCPPYLLPQKGAITYKPSQRPSKKRREKQAVNPSDEEEDGNHRYPRFAVAGVTEQN